MQFLAERVEAVKNYTDDTETIELAKMLDGVDAPCLQAAIDDMKAEYGSVKGYLKEKIGLTDDDLIQAVLDVHETKFTNEQARRKTEFDKQRDELKCELTRLIK